MRCDTQQGTLVRERCMFTSILLLGALFGLSASPCARAPMVSAAVIVGVPLMTFGIAAPSRLGLLNEIALLWRGLQALVLSGLLMALGRFDGVRAVRQRLRLLVEASYRNVDPRLANAVEGDPDLLHHARRLGGFAALLGVLAGVSLPFVWPSVYTYGSWPEAPIVFALDFLVLGVVGRVATERMAIRLFEAASALRDASPTLSRLRAAPLTTMLGGALGAVAALVIVSAGAMACAVETAWLSSGSLYEPAFWFIRRTAPLALPLGVAVGSIIGLGMGLAHAPLRSDEETPELTR